MIPAYAIESHDDAQRAFSPTSCSLTSGQRLQAVDVARQLAHTHARQAREPPVDFLEVVRLLRLPRPIELPFEAVRQHAVDDEPADIDAGVASSSAARAVSSIASRSGIVTSTNDVRPRSVTIVAQLGQPLVPALERGQHRIGGRRLPRRVCSAPRSISSSARRCFTSAWIQVVIASGMRSSCSVWPVGAVSNTIRS